jgi:hypothetical protein
LWLGKMVVDVGFAAIALIRLAGDSLFADDEADDEVAIHSEDLAVSDTMLFQALLLASPQFYTPRGYAIDATAGEVICRPEGPFFAGSHVLDASRNPTKPGTFSRLVGGG